VKGRKIFYYSAIACVGLSVILVYGAALASSLTVKVNNLYMDLEAAQAPLSDVLQAISEKTGIVLKIAGDLNEPISINLKEISIEKCLQRLMENRNYVLLFRKVGEGEFIPVELRVVDKGGIGNKDHLIATNEMHSVGSNDDVEKQGLGMKCFDRKSFEKDFGDTNRLIGQITADTTMYGEGTEDFGIRIISMSEDSAFNKLGIEPGNIILDVNGQPAKNIWDFIQSFNNAYKEKVPIIRIARLKNNHEYNPIYIKFQDK
jgi:hypothetical protein